MSSAFVPIEMADLDWKKDLPFSIQFQDIYHSSEGSLQQSRYVFINGNDLINRWSSLSPGTFACFNIGETGFGTGVNFLLTWKLWEEYAPKDASLHFISCEKHPLSKVDLIRTLSLWPALEQYANQLIGNYPVLTPGFHHLLFADGKVKLTLILGDAYESFEQLLICGDFILEKEIRRTYIDAWFLDGFSPSKNQAMWSESLFEVIAMLSKVGTTIATYTAAAPVKLALRNCGFSIEKKKGFGPKRHMISAVYLGHPIETRKSKHTPWHASISNHKSEKSALIIGAGLAGCFLANFLAKRNWQVTVLEKKESVAQGGSGNQQAVLFPKLSAYKSPFTQYMLLSFLYANRYYREILENHPIGALTGSLLLDYNEKEKNGHRSLQDWLRHYPELGELVDEKQASELTGLDLQNSGLFIPLSGWINSPELCQILLQHTNIHMQYCSEVNDIHYMDEKWHVQGRNAPILVLTNSHEATRFEQTNYLPIKTIGGQMTMINATSDSTNLKMPICGDGHVLPLYKGCHHIGATYHLAATKVHSSSQDDITNLSKLKQLSESTHWSEAIVDNWVGIRATSPDYLPIVGTVAKEQEFLEMYSGLQSNSKRWIPKPGPYYPGLYICAAFGSRGLTTVPLAAEWLASSINNELLILPRNLIQALSPARFLRKKIIHGF